MLTQRKDHYIASVLKDMNTDFIYFIECIFCPPHKRELLPLVQKVIHAVLKRLFKYTSENLMPESVGEP